MPKTFSKVKCLALLALLILGAPLAGSAEVIRIEVTRRDDVLGGRPFGTAGRYERVVGTIHFAVDRSHPRNARIADLDKAPRNRQGRVEFSADIYIIKPKDPSRGNSVLLFDVLNVGRQRLLGRFNNGTASNDPSTEAHFGDGSLLRDGYTLVSVGWQFDVPRTQGRLALDAPIATDAGRPITGWVRMWFIPSQPAASFEYVAGNNTAAYPPIEPADRRYRLTVRDGTPDGPRLIPREQWRFARDVEGRLVPDPNFIWLKGGLQAGQTYEVAYEARNPPVAGLGLAALRDTASAFKYGDDSLAPGRYAYLYGSSQTGRFVRRILYDGFTIAEDGRKAFDAAMVNTGGTVMGSFNERFAQPNDLGAFTQTKFPFLYRPSIDPVTGQEDGLGARIPSGLEPKIFLMDTASEYWDLGRLSALRHVSIDGSEDVSDAPNVRVYHFAGTAHAAGALPPAAGAGQLRTNPLNYDWGHRALLTALDHWVREGREPPRGMHPRVSDATLVPRRSVTFPAIPDMKLPLFVPGGYRRDVPMPHAALPFLVPAVDADGNENGGIRLPSQAVPLATFTGWQFRTERMGAPHTLVMLSGAYVPFPRTRMEREQTGDPRLSIEERYTSRSDYLQRVEAAGRRLARERYLLEADVAAIVAEAGEHWDWLTAR